MLTAAVQHADPAIDGPAQTSEVDAIHCRLDVPHSMQFADITEPAGKGESYGSHAVVARTISNATTHPGKTFYGCSYRLEMLDKDGAAL